MRQPATPSFVAAIASPSLTLACPVCDTPTGQQIRSGILNHDLTTNLFATLAPFPILLLIVAAIHFGLPVIKRPPRKNENPHDHHD